MRNSTKKKTKTGRRGRPRQFNESEVLDAITDEFWRGGFAGTPLDALSSATGLARPSLYAAFGDKEAMFLAALQNFFGRIEAATQSARGSSAPLDQTVRNIFNVLIDLYTADGARGCLLVCTAAAEAPTHDNVRKELARLLSKVDAGFASLLEAARQHGELEPDVDIDALAGVLAGVTHTLAVRARAGTRRQRLREFAAAAVSQLQLA